ncbi:hypothetical protein NS44R_14960 [Mammaliicoccus sciuri]|nr:hypothetical protein NS44R_14960 [Mammaliicoccus sciuri]
MLRSSIPVHRLGRLGQAVVRDRLPALGLGRAVARAAGRRQRRQPASVLSRQCEAALRYLIDGASCDCPGGRTAAGFAKVPRDRRAADRRLQRQG